MGGGSPMHDWMWFATSAFCLLLGAVGRNFRVGRLTGNKGPRVPTWVGRTWFFAIAGFCLFMGIKPWL